MTDRIFVPKTYFSRAAGSRTWSSGIGFMVCTPSSGSFMPQSILRIGRMRFLAPQVLAGRNAFHLPIQRVLEQDGTENAVAV